MRPVDWRRAVRLLAAVTVLAVTATAALLAGAGALLRSEPAQRLVRQQVAALLGEATGFRVRLGAIGGDGIGTLHLNGVRLRHEGEPVLDVDRLEIRWSPLALLGGRLHLREIVLDGVRARLVRTVDGWRLPSPERSGTASSPTAPAVIVDRLRLRRARIGVALLDADLPRRLAISALSLEGRLRVAGGALRLDVHRVAGTPRGIAVSPLRARGAVLVTAAGAVVVPDLALDSARSGIRGRMEIGPAGGFRGRLRLDPLDRTELAAAVPGARLGASLHGEVAAAGTLERLGIRAVARLGDRGRLALRAVLGGLAAPIPSWHGTLLAEAFDPAAASPELPRGRVAGRLVASGRGIWPTPAGRYRLVLGPSAIGDRRIEGARLDGRMSGARHRAALRATLDGARARLRLAALVAPVLAWRARGEIAVVGLNARRADGPDPVRLAIRGRGRHSDPTAREATLGVTLAPTDALGVRLHRGRADATLRGSSVRIRRMVLGGPALLVEGEGGGDLRSATLHATLRAQADLGALPSLTSGTVGGRVTLEAGIAGSPHTFEGTAVTNVAGLRVADLPPWDLRTAIRWNRGAGTDIARVRVEGTGDGGRRLDVDLGLRHADRRTAIQIDAMSLVLPEVAPWALAAPASIRIAPGPLVDVPELSLAASGQRLAVRARLGPAGRLEVALGVHDLALAPLCTAASIPACAGTLRGQLRVRGTTTSPIAEARLEVPDLVIEGVRYGRLVVDSDYAARRLRALGQLDYPAAGRLEFEGTMPVDLGPTRPPTAPAAEPLSLRLRAHALDLRAVPTLAPGLVRELDGRVSGDVTLTGPRHRLVPTGFVELFADRLVLRASGVTFRDVHARLRADAGGVELAELALRGGDGTLEGRGRLTLASGRPPELAGRFVFSDFLAVRVPAYEATVTGELDLGGTLETPRLAGSLEVVRAVLRPGLLPADTAALEPDPTIEVVGRGAGPPEEPRATSDRLIGALDLAIRIRLARNAWIRLPDAQIELAGDLAIDKVSGEDPRISGEILLRRGWYRFQGRRFTLDEGRFVLAGEYPPDPVIHVRAAHRTGGYAVTLHLTGTVARPSLTLASEPPLDQADILAVLLFGRPSHELAAAEGLDLQRQAISLASSYIVPELQTSVMEALGLDTLEVGEDAVRAGRYVTRDVFVAIAQQLGPTPAQAVAVEYSLTRRLSLKASTSTTGRSAIDLEWRHRY